MNMKPLKQSKPSKPSKPKFMQTFVVVRRKKNGSINIVEQSKPSTPSKPTTYKPKIADRTFLCPAFLAEHAYLELHNSKTH